MGATPPLSPTGSTSHWLTPTPGCTPSSGIKAGKMAGAGETAEISLPGHREAGAAASAWSMGEHLDPSQPGRKYVRPRVQLRKPNTQGIMSDLRELSTVLKRVSGGRICKT